MEILGAIRICCLFRSETELVPVKWSSYIKFVGLNGRVLKSKWQELWHFTNLY